jgi:hypothetical protein
MKPAIRNVIQVSMVAGLAGVAYFLGQWQRSHEDGKNSSSATAKNTSSASHADLEKSPPPPPAQDSAATQALVSKLMNDAGPFNPAHLADLKKVVSALSQLVKIDPQLALNYLDKLTSANGALGSGDYRAIFADFGTNDPATGKMIAELLPPGSEQNGAITGLFSSWIRTDPQAALDWYAIMRPGQPLTGVSWLENIANNSPHPEVAAQFISNIQDETTRNAYILRIAPLFGAGPNKDPDAAMDWLNQVATGATYNKAVTSIVTSLAKNDPAAAASVLNKITDPAILQASIATVASGWGSKDPQAALTWAQTLPDSDAATQASALNSIVTSWSKSDPNAVAAYVQSSATPSLYLPADPAIAQSLATSNPQAALTFSNSLPDGSVKNQAINNVLTTEAQTDFTAAWTAATSLPATDNPTGVMSGLVGVQAKIDPTQAAALISLFPDEAGQVAATTTLAAIWVKQDPQAFTVWLNDLPVGGPRDAAIVQLASSAQASKDPAGVMVWVNTVSDPQTKVALTQKLTQTQAASKP